MGGVDLEGVISSNLKAYFGLNRIHCPFFNENIKIFNVFQAKLSADKTEIQKSSYLIKLNINTVKV